MDEGKELTQNNNTKKRGGVKGKKFCIRHARSFDCMGGFDDLRCSPPPPVNSTVTIGQVRAPEEVIKS
jgi:hypothetical protein